MKFVIGLDRDGTINKDIGTYVTHPKDFGPIAGSLEAIKLMRQKDYDVVILTNQAGIHKGLMTPVDVDVVNQHMLQLLGNIGKISKMKTQGKLVRYVSKQAITQVK